MTTNILNNKVEMTRSLLVDYFKNCNKLGNELKDILYNISEKHIEDNSVLLQLYLAVFNKKDKYINEDSNIIYTYDGSKCSIQYENNIQYFELEALRETIAHLVDLTENILPLGTLVELKKEYFSKVFDVDKVDKIRVVITYRFIDLENKSFYTYGGVVYPVANFNKAEILRFSPALIEKVIHRGFSDEQEEAYVYLMKRELGVENNMLSSGFYIGDEKSE